MEDALVWQLVDSAFPTGAFAHSLGLESAWHHGEIASRDDLRRFVEATILQAASGALPLVNGAYREPSRLAEWDALNDAFLSNAVGNRASRQQGRTLVASAARIWALPALEALQRRITSSPNAQRPTPNAQSPTPNAQSPTPNERPTPNVHTSTSQSCAHVAPVTGAVFAALGIPLETTQRVVLFVAARGVLSAAVRLGVIGSYDAQRLQSDSVAWATTVHGRYRHAGPDDLAQTAPVIDLLQGAHDRLYSRLFQS
ncbi:MAG: urease accessory UreF family protein [Vicinamibacteraceae bacterium]